MEYRLRTAIETTRMCLLALLAAFALPLYVSQSVAATALADEPAVDVRYRSCRQ